MALKMYKCHEINADGHNIRCKLYCNDLGKADQVVIFGTGFGGHKDNNTARGFAEKLHIAEHGNPFKKVVLLCAAPLWTCTTC